jgi:hypothetical protein
MHGPTFGTLMDACGTLMAVLSSQIQHDHGHSFAERLRAAELLLQTIKETGELMRLLELEREVRHLQSFIADRHGFPDGFHD